MQKFEFSRASGIDEALSLHAQKAAAAYIAGGTTLVDLMKIDVLSPERLVDINKLGLKSIEKNGDSLLIGALVTNSELAQHKTIRHEFPVLSEAILSGASVQLRNMASVGGNIMQKTRCYYYRDNAFACNKRVPGSGCPAIEGFNRMHAILGGSDSCVAVHASDMCVALLALDASVRVSGNGGTRSVRLQDFYLLPESTPERETVLEPGELITHLELPFKSFSGKSHYLKVRDRASYAFALCSAAVALELSGGKIKDCRLALGGVATKPWRAFEAEKLLLSKAPSRKTFQDAAAEALAQAKALKFNGFKVELCKRTIVRAFEQLTAGES